MQQRGQTPVRRILAAIPRAYAETSHFYEGDHRGYIATTDCP